MATKKPEWLIMLILIAAIIGFFNRRSDRKRFIAALSEGPEFKPTFLEFDAEFAPAKARKWLIAVGVLSLALVAAAFCYPQHAVLLLCLLGLLVLPIAFLLWSDYRREAPVRRVDFGMEEVGFHFADGADYRFRLDSGTSLEVSVQLERDSHLICVTFSDGGRSCRTPLGFEGEVGFLAHCRDEGVVLRWASEAPGWFKKKLLASPGWQAGDFQDS